MYFYIAILVFPTNFLLSSPALVLSRVLRKRIINCTLRSWINERRIVSKTGKNEKSHSVWSRTDHIFFLFLIITLSEITIHLSLGHYNSKLSSYKMISMHFIICIETCIKLQLLSVFSFKLIYAETLHL